MPIPSHEERLTDLRTIATELRVAVSSPARRFRVTVLSRYIDQSLASGVSESMSAELYLDVIRRLVRMADPVCREDVEATIDLLNAMLPPDSPQVGAIRLVKPEPDRVQDLAGLFDRRDLRHLSEVQVEALAFYRAQLSAVE